MFEILFSGLTPRTFRTVTDTFEHVSFFLFFSSLSSTFFSFLFHATDGLCQLFERTLK